MDKQLKLIKDLKNELRRMKKLKNSMVTDMKIVPEGTLMKRSDGRLFHVSNKNKKKEQIRLNEDDQNDKTLINLLKYKRYIKEALPILNVWIKHIEEMLNNICIYDPLEIQNKLKKQYHGLEGIPVFLDGDINPYEYQSGEYKKMYGEGLIYPSEKGLMTRSKSESQIASKYEDTGWQFEYEPEIELQDGTVLRPDFKVLHPYKRKWIYHEHFGMMDKPEYAMKALKKLEEYEKVGIRLGDNLVITAETRNEPLTFQKINETISKIKSM